MAKNRQMKLVNIMIALALVLSSIAVGNAMISGLLSVPIVGLLINQIAGWVVVIAGIISGLQTVGLMKK